MAKQSDGNELGIIVPNQKCVVRCNLYQFHSKAATTDIAFAIEYQRVPLPTVVC